MGIEQGIQQGIEQGIEQGELSTKRLLARNMIAKGLAPALVVEISGLTEDEVMALMQQRRLILP